MLRKAGSLIFLCVIVLNMIGMYPFYKYVQYKLKRRAENSLTLLRDESKLMVLDIAKANEPELTWTEAGHEFIYQGSHYDIKRKEIITTGTRYFCYHDQEETQLAFNMEEILSLKQDKNQQPASDLTLNFFKIFFQLYITVKQPTEERILIPEEDQTFFRTFYSSGFLEKYILPPRSV